MNQFPSPALVLLPWLYLPVVVVLLIGLCAVMFDDVRRTRRAHLVLSENEMSGETPPGPDTSRP